MFCRVVFVCFAFFPTSFTQTFTDIANPYLTTVNTGRCGKPVTNPFNTSSEWMFQLLITPNGRSDSLVALDVDRNLVWEQLLPKRADGKDNELCCLIRSKEYGSDVLVTSHGLYGTAAGKLITGSQDSPRPSADSYSFFVQKSTQLLAQYVATQPRSFSINDTGYQLVSNKFSGSNGHFGIVVGVATNVKYSGDIKVYLWNETTSELLGVWQSPQDKLLVDFVCTQMVNGNPCCVFSEGEPQYTVAINRTGHTLWQKEIGRGYGPITAAISDGGNGVWLFNVAGYIHNGIPFTTPVRVDIDDGTVNYSWPPSVLPPVLTSGVVYATENNKQLFYFFTYSEPDTIQVLNVVEQEVYSIPSLPNYDKVRPRVLAVLQDRVQVQVEGVAEEGFTNNGIHMCMEIHTVGSLQVPPDPIVLSHRTSSGGIATNFTYKLPNPSKYFYVGGFELWWAFPTSNNKPQWASVEFVDRFHECISGEVPAQGALDFKLVTAYASTSGGFITTNGTQFSASIPNLTYPYQSGTCSSYYYGDGSINELIKTPVNWALLIPYINGATPTYPGKANVVAFSTAAGLNCHVNDILNQKYSVQGSFVVQRHVLVSPTPGNESVILRSRLTVDYDGNGVTDDTFYYPQTGGETVTTYYQQDPNSGVRTFGDAKFSFTFPPFGKNFSGDGLFSIEFWQAGPGSSVWLQAERDSQPPYKFGVKYLNNPGFSILHTSFYGAALPPSCQNA